MRKIYIVRYNDTSPGVRVITDAFSKILREDGYIVTVTNQFPTVLKDNESLITYGPKETYDAIRKKLPVSVALLVDSYSLGQLNKARFFLKRGKVFYKDLWYSLITGLLYRKRENIIARKVKHLMFVSLSDIEEFKRRNPDNDYYYVPNGVNIPEIESTFKVPSDCIRLGVLSNWNDATVQECQWFVEDILPKLNENIGARLVVAGRGASEKTIKYFKSNPYIDYLGEVNTLSDFFNNIDIYVATVPRGCGILNKVLDAFAFRTFVIGISESFSGFSKMKDSYIECSSYDEFFNAIKKFKNPLITDKYIQNASEYIFKNNNWEINYTKFLIELKNNQVI